MRREADAVSFAIRRLLAGTQFAADAMAAAQESLGALAQQLIAPLSVPPDVPLVIVPAGALVNLLWSPLHTAPVSVTPSGSLWVRACRTAPAGQPSTVALIAGPHLDGASRELDAVAARYPGARTLLPPFSTVDATVELVKDAQLAHLACHGRFRSDSPLFSSLELSDGQLTLYEMLERGVAPGRVVLASCNSGTQRPYDGDEVIGFVSAMMCHGSAGVVAAEMPIPDGVCADVMAVLHDRIGKGETLASAVWHARSAVEGGGPQAYVAGCVLTAYGPG